MYTPWVSYQEAPVGGGPSNTKKKTEGFPGLLGNGQHVFFFFFDLLF